MGTILRQPGVLDDKIDGPFCKITANNWTKKRGPILLSSDHLSKRGKKKTATKLTNSCDEGQKHLAAENASHVRVNRGAQHHIPTHHEKTNSPPYFKSRAESWASPTITWKRRAGQSPFRYRPPRNTTLTESRQQEKCNEKGWHHNHSSASTASSRRLQSYCNCAGTKNITQAAVTVHPHPRKPS